MNISILKSIKKVTRKLNQKLNIRNERLETAIDDLDNKMKTNKETLFDKEYVKIKKDTFDSMNKVISESKKVMEIQPALKKVYNEVDTYTKVINIFKKKMIILKKKLIFA